MEQANKDHSNRMAAKWADPEYKKKCMKPDGAIRD